MAAQAVGGALVVLYQHRRAGAARQRFQTQRPGAGKQVQTIGAGQNRIEPIEQGLAHPVTGRAQPLHIGNRQFAAAPAATDDAQAAWSGMTAIGVRRAVLGQTDNSCRGARDGRIHDFAAIAPGPVNTEVRMSHKQHDTAAADGAQRNKGGVFGLFRRKPAGSDTAAPASAADGQPRADTRSRIRRALSRTGAGVGALLLGGKSIDKALLDELETLLLMADVGVDATAEIIESLTAAVKRSELKDSAALYSALQEVLQHILSPCEQPLLCDAEKTPFVLLVVGVNGVGKTTTIGKLAKQLQAEDKQVMLAAGDTFRAAAVEQLQAWGERNDIAVVAQHSGADSASVIYDAIQSARAKGVDVVIADTAGRLHTKSNLMEELKKVQRVIAKLDASAPHEVLLVVDAGTGQNGLTQMQQFHDALGVTGIALTKLDGTAKGGIAFALCRRFGVPIRYIGIGEGVDDLRVFNAGEFVTALLGAAELE